MPSSSTDRPPVVWWNWKTQTWDRKRIARSPMAQTVGSDGRPDGQWQIDWECDDTTSYTVTHLPTGRQVLFYASADLALRAIGSGAALRAMDARDAEQAGGRVEVGAVAR
jgi:hypothetical protein